MKPVALAIIIRHKADSDRYEILTQIRLVQNKSYDPLYHRTMEAVGETLEKDKEREGYPAETFLEAALRGVREECGPEREQPEADHARAFPSRRPRC